jgi:hypothetical protein
MSLAEDRTTIHIAAADVPGNAEGCCHAAKEAFEDIIDNRPLLDDERLTKAIGKVIRLRDALIAERRRGNFPAARETLLQRVNAILSLTVSAEFPLVGVRWERIVGVRDALRALAADEKICRIKNSSEKKG